MASIEKRGNSYKIIVSAGYDMTGKKIRKTTTFTPSPFTATGREKAASVIEKEVAEYAADFERQVRNGTLCIGSEMKFHELVKKYLEEYAYIELGPYTADGYRAILEGKLLPAWGHVYVRDLCKNQLGLQSYFNDIAKPGQDGRTLSASTVRRYMAVMSSVFTWAVNMQIIPSNPLTRVKPPRKPFCKESPKNFTADELKRFIQALDMPLTATYKAHERKTQSGIVYSVPEYLESRAISEQFKLFYILAAFSGRRRGELLALDWEDLDFDAGTISISKSLSKTGKGLIIKGTKTKSGICIINMPASVMQQAKEWKIHQAEQRMRLGTAWKGKGNIFSQADGSRMYPDTVTSKFKDIIRNYNSQCKEGEKLPEITLHGLRHTAASILINQGTDIATVSKRLGHSRTSVTLDIYTHAIKEADKAAADKLELIAKEAGI